MDTPYAPLSDARLVSLLRALPFPTSPQHTLSLGCGAYSEYHLLAKQWKHGVHIGVDLDSLWIRTASSQAGRIIADLRALPLRHAVFCLVVVRHPDIDQQPDLWHHLLTTIEAFLAPKGILLVTTYSLHERDFITTHAPNNLYLVSLPDEHIAPPNWAGRDRFPLAYAKA